MMDRDFKNMKHKIEDYSRFLMTLIILSVYFYLGMIITSFIEPSDKNQLLIILLLASLALAGWFTYLLNKWKKQLNDIVDQ